MVTVINTIGWTKHRYSEVIDLYGKYGITQKKYFVVAVSNTPQESSLSPNYILYYILPTGLLTVPKWQVGKKELYVRNVIAVSFVANLWSLTAALRGLNVRYTIFVYASDGMARHGTGGN